MDIVLGFLFLMGVFTWNANSSDSPDGGVQAVQVETRHPHSSTQTVAPRTQDTCRVNRLERHYRDLTVPLPHVAAEPLPQTSDNEIGGWDE